MWRMVFAVLAALPVMANAQRNLTVAGEQRVALVIGNASYKSSPLKNPVNDAKAMAERLQRLGFVVIKRENMTAKQIGPALREFRSRLSAGSTALFFYAGHGLQVKGVNYLPTVDAEIEAEEDVPTQSLDVSKVLELMEDAKTRVNLVFLDACRDNPFARKFRGGSRGLAKVDAASGTLISFATRPGSVAADGQGQNGLYTEYLLKHMETPGLPVEQMLKRVGAGVKVASKGRQEPWSEGLIEGDFYFRSGPQMVSTATSATSASSGSLELALWDSVKDSHNAEELGAYLERYPNGEFAAVARTRLKGLASATPSSAVAPPPSSTIPHPGAAFRDCDVCPEMVPIPPGSFIMGSPDSEVGRYSHEGPQHLVTISYSFAVGKYEITFDEWDACVREKGCFVRSDSGWGRGRRPVIFVDLYGTQQYTNWLSRKTGKRYRLLSEAEWEYVARAGTTTVFSWGNSITPQQANYDASSSYAGSQTGTKEGKTVEVGRYAPNAFGLYDVHGNVAEWVEDCWFGGYGWTGAPSDGSAAKTPYRCSEPERIVRGGSWSDSPQWLRSASHTVTFKSAGGNTVGFRVARTN